MIHVLYSWLFKKIDFSTYLFLERGDGREKERERNTDWLPVAHPKQGPWFTAQACALTGNQTGDLSVYGTMPNPLSHISQSYSSLLKNKSVNSAGPLTFNFFNKYCVSSLPYDFLNIFLFQTYFIVGIKYITHIQNMW